MGLLTCVGRVDGLTGRDFVNARRSLAHSLLSRGNPISPNATRGDAEHARRQLYSLVGASTSTVGTERQIPMDPLAASPFALLDARGSLCLVIDAVDEDDALCLALTCRAARDALWVRFELRPEGDPHAGKRIRTRDAAVVSRVSRLAWARSLPDRPKWLPARGVKVKFTGLPQNSQVDLEV